jgi:hypothetical protein
LAEWLLLYPGSKIMQADPVFVKSYDSTMKYESGLSRNRSIQDRVIYDTLNNSVLLLVLASDNKSFFAFATAGIEKIILKNDTLLSGSKHFAINGRGIDTSFNLAPLPAYQEFWHSWRTFNPGTSR